MIDLEALARWMDQRALGRGPIEHVRPLSGGTQNVMLRYARDGREYVLRRPPAHPRSNSNEIMRREMRVLAALRDSDVPHARLIASSPEAEVLGCSFYLMEPVEGFNATVGLPPLHAGDAALRHGMGLALIDGLLRLGARGSSAAGLMDLGKVDGFLERQVAPLDEAARRLSGLCAGWPGAREIPGRRAHRRSGSSESPAERLHGRASCMATIISPTSCSATMARSSPRSSIGNWPRLASRCSIWGSC